MADSIVKVILTGDSKGLHRAVDGATKDMEHAGKSAGTAGGSIKAGLAVGAGAAVAFGLDAIKAFEGQQEAQDHLERAIKNAGGTWDDYSKRVKNADASGTQFGYDNGQINQALATMTSGLNSPTKALDHLQLAEDIAAAKGMDLNAAAMLATKGMEGQIKPLKALGLDLPIAAAGAVKLKAAQDNVTKAEAALQYVEQKIHDGRLKGPAAADALRTANMNLKGAQDKLTTAQQAGNEITKELTKRYQGSAGDAANTFAGKVAAQAAAWRNVKAEAGHALTDGLIKFQEWSKKTGRPEIMRIQGDLNALANKFNGVATVVDHVTTTIANDIGKLTGAMSGLGSGLADALGLGGNPNGTPGAAQRDRARLDAQNRARQRASQAHTPAHPHGAPTPHQGPTPANVTVHVHVHGSDPAAVTRAIQAQARRNGVAVS